MRQTAPAQATAGTPCASLPKICPARTRISALCQDAALPHPLSTAASNGSASDAPQHRAVANSLRLAVAAASWLAFAHSLWFAWRYFEATPWLDMWDWVGEFRAWQDGHFGWANLVAAHNDHRIATARVLFLIDTLFFHMTGRFVTTVNMVVLVLLGLLLHRIWRSRAVAVTPADLPAIFFVAVMTSVCQWENLVTPFQVQFSLLLLFSALATVLAVHGTSTRLPRRRAAACLLAAALCFGLAAYSMAGGVTLLPILLVLMVARRTPVPLMLVFAIPACLIVLAFFQNYPWPVIVTLNLNAPGLPAPETVLRMAAVGLEFPGSAFGGLGGPVAIAAGAAGMAALAVLIRRSWRSGHPIGGAEAAFLALAAFVVANAAAAARLRGFSASGAAWLRAIPSSACCSSSVWPAPTSRPSLRG